MRPRDEITRLGPALLLGAALVLVAPPIRAQSEVEELREQLDTTRRELATTRQALAELTRRVESLQTASAPARTPGTTARLAPVNADNPAISVVVDTTFASDMKSSADSIGYPDGSGFRLGGAELFISAPIDPFLRGYASVVASSDEGFNVEEAALVTTALPWNLTAKGGRFFANVGRLPRWHNESLPFAYRPASIERLIGGESGAEGLEVSWLAPLDRFVELTAGAYNTVGIESLEELNEEGFFGRRSMSELTYLARPHTYVDFTDATNLELGGTWLGVPAEDERSLFGVDATLRHQPGTSGFYQGLVWGTEWYWQSQLFRERDDDGVLLGEERFRRTGGYSYLEAFFARAWSGGALFDYSESPEGDVDRLKTASAFLTWKPSEFHRLRFQVDNTWGDQSSNARLTLQWTAFLGSHRHGFAQR